MGNGQSQGVKKKKKGHVKEGAHLDDGSLSGPQELENGDLQHEGLDQFYKDRSRRKDVTKDLFKQIGMASHDCGKGDDRNLSDNHASPNKAIPGDVGFAVQDGKDPIDAVGDSSLANGHAAGNESDRISGDTVPDESIQTDHVLVDPGLSPAGHPCGAPRDVAISTSGNVPASAPGDAPGDVAVDTSGDVPDNAPSNASGNNSGVAARNVAISPTGNAPASAPDVGPCDVYGDNPGTGPENASVKTPGDIPVGPAQSGLVPNPSSYPLQANPTQQKMSTTGNNTSSSEQTRSGKAPPQEQNEYISDTTSDQSIPTIPQSKTEFSTPSTMEIVPGVPTKPSKDKDAESLKGENYSKGI